MKSICIKTNNSYILDYLLNELKYIDLEFICFSSNEFKNYKNIIIHYQGPDVDVFLDQISSILSYLVIDEFEENMLKRIIFKNFFYFNELERQKILENCFGISADDFTDIFNKKFDCLKNSFYEYLNENKSIVLYGFINFRLTEYYEILEEIVDEAVNIFIVEKEYLEFISLLRLYVNSQKSEVNIIHIFYSDKDSLLLDENKNIINISDDISKVKYLSDISFSTNDYILNTLLNLLPKKIYVHITQNCVDEFVNTLSLIFEDRLKICNDCDICRLYRKSTISKTK